MAGSGLVLSPLPVHAPEPQSSVSLPPLQSCHRLSLVDPDVIFRPPWYPFLLSPPMDLMMLCPSCDLCGLGDVLFLSSQMLPTPLSSQISSKINNRTVHSPSSYIFWPKDPRAPYWLVFSLSVPALGNSTTERGPVGHLLCAPDFEMYRSDLPNSF